MVFGADGITAASNREDEKFGIERASEAIRRACEAGLPAEETIDRILAEVETFRCVKGHGILLSWWSWWTDSPPTAARRLALLHEGIRRPAGTGVHVGGEITWNGNSMVFAYHDGAKGQGVQRQCPT